MDRKTTKYELTEKGGSIFVIDPLQPRGHDEKMMMTHIEKLAAVHCANVIHSLDKNKFTE